MSEDATTLMARDETSGRTYPMVLERVFFVLAIVAVSYTHLTLPTKRIV